MTSIRRTLGLRLAGGALVLLALAAAALYGGVRWLLTDQFDGTLREKVATFATLVEQDGDVVELGAIESALPELHSAERPEYVQLWLADRDDDWVLYRSPTLGGGNLPNLAAAPDVPTFWDLRLPDGRRGRAIGAQFTIAQFDPAPERTTPARVAMVLARETASLDAALARLAAWTAALIALALVSGSLVVARALRGGLRPLDALAEHVAAIGDPVAAQPFVAPGVPSELAPLVESHNRMLQRIQAAFARERRTAANIAHELRTPVAELVALVDAFEHEPSANAPARARSLAELRDIGLQMSAVISTLLELGRMESGHVPLEVESVDLAEMVRDCWSPLASSADAKGQSFQALPAGGPRVRADRVALSILLANLLRNAVDHAPAGDHIRCEIEEGGARCWLVVSNQAGELAREDLDKLAEPFWRSSPAREDRNHAGIGLSLARRFAELLEAELSFHLERGTFRARLGLQPG